MERNGELRMIFPMVAGKLLLSGGFVSCQCCTPEVPDPPSPGLDILMATATSAGGKLGCAMGPVIKNFANVPPYALAAGTYQLRVDFTSADERYHVGSYYELHLSFTPATAMISWETSASGVAGDPWSVTNGGKTVRFNLEDSFNCGGINDNTQSGTAIATITVATATDMDFDFDGIAELEDSGYENISFYLRSI